MRTNRLRWLRHIERKYNDDVVTIINEIRVKGNQRERVIKQRKVGKHY